jgi:diguanylate cyclase (GGDEF)-like protein/PAS domain S-box-containing protein
VALHTQRLTPEEAEQRFRISFDHAPIGMAIVAPDGRMLQVNPALCRITGLPEEDLLGTTRQDLTHPDDRRRNFELASQLLAGETDSFEMEKRYRHADGNYVWIHLSVSLVRDAAKEPRYFIAQIQDIHDRKLVEVELRHLADHDTLTDLLNRHGFERQLNSRIRTARKTPGGALLVVDLDNFKYVNDSLGHQAGDHVIQAVGRILRGYVAESDLVARRGGDEFAILLADGDADEALHLAQTLLDAIRATPMLSQARAHRLTTCIGITVLDGSQRTADEAMGQADTAMYTAKEAGRDQVRLWADGSVAQRNIAERMTWVGRIEDAFQNDGFVMLAQPILTLATGSVHHYELLLRMRDADGGLIPPIAFLPTAERFDLIQGIDRWVLEHALHLLQNPGGARHSLAANLSGRSIGDAAILDLLRRELPKIPGGAGRLTIEITETATVADLSVAGDFAEDLRSLGCRVALDDFGVGFGSFAYLKHLPFDSVKIDGDFVKACTSNPTDRLIIEAIVGVAKGLGRETVAEFVEDAETVQYLRSVGVDHCQGYFISRPLPVTEAFTFRPPRTVTTPG